MHSIDAAFCDRCDTHITWSVCLSVCLWVGYTDVLSRNSGTDQDAT